MLQARGQPWHVHAVDLPVEQFEDLGGDGGDRVAVGEAVEQDDELVAAPARHGVFGAHAAVRAGDVLQHEVAAVVAETVVDALEAVEVDEQHCHHAARAGTAGDRPLQPVEQQAAAGQPGEGVVGGFVAQPLGEATLSVTSWKASTGAAFAVDGVGSGSVSMRRAPSALVQARGAGSVTCLPSVMQRQEELAEPGGFGGEAAQGGRPAARRVRPGLAPSSRPATGFMKRRPCHRPETTPVGDGRRVASAWRGPAAGCAGCPTRRSTSVSRCPHDPPSPRRGHPPVPPEQHAAGGEGQQQPAGGEGNP